MRISIPMPLQIVIDDAGWWSGKNDGTSGNRNGPFRTGMCRDHLPADYQALVSLGRQLGMRPQAAMVLCEWDRTNLLRRIPTSTWMGEDWDNRRWTGPRLEEGASILSEGREHLEFTLHGLGHEYWENGIRTRAEWHDKKGHMRPKDQVEAHLSAYFTIMEQNGFNEQPLSFVPCAFLHALGDEKEGFPEILKSLGIRYISTPFSRMRKAKEPEDRWFGVDRGIVTVDRGDAGIRWDAVSAEPPDMENLRQPLLGIHWPNLLHPDPARNEEVVSAWVRKIKDLETRFDRILSPDTPSCWTQLVYHRVTEIARKENTILLDFSRVDALGALYLEDSFTLRIETGADKKIKFSGLTLLSRESAPEKKFRTFLLRRLPGRCTAEIRWR